MPGLDPRFVLAPSLQMYFVDKLTGEPLSGGIVTFYSDENRTQLKPVYEISGTPPNYVYTPLPNPVILSGVGTFQDDSGNDVLPYYFPYDGTPDNSNGDVELYYITVTDANNLSQFVREGWPNVSSNGSGGTTFNSSSNLVINNIFTNNIGQTQVAIPNTTVLAPGAHTSFQTTDITFQRTGTVSNDQITFMQFGAGNDPLLPDQTPIYYLNYSCPVAATGETRKEIEIPLQPFVKNLENLTFTFDIWAQGVSGTQALSVSVLQYFGDGPSAAITVRTPVGTGAIQLTPFWTQYSATVTIPSSAGTTLGLCGNDGTYLEIGMPLNTASQINFTKPKFYSGPFIPNSIDITSYDQLNAVLSSSRTGEIKTSVNSVVPYGFVPMNDGTIGSATSSATTRANIDTFFLYQYIWKSVSNTYAPVTGGRGASAFADFSANKTIALTKMVGRAMAGIAAPQQITTWVPTVSSTNITPASMVGLYVGVPVILSTGGSLPTTTNPSAQPFQQIQVGRTYYVANVTSTTISLAQTASDAIANTNLFTYTNVGTGTFTLAIAYPLGFFQGKEFQLISDMPSHTHTIAPPSYANWVDPPDGTLIVNGGGTDARFDRVTPTLSNTGGDSPTGIMQPTTYLNVFIKL